jgi:transcription initiation factor TFIIB
MVQVEENRNACPECSSNIIVHDPESGEDICGNCGLVLNAEVLSNKITWHPYNEEDKRQTGSPETLALHDKGLSTVIGSENRDAFGRKLPSSKQFEMIRLRKWQIRSRCNGSYERSLAAGLGCIGLACDKLGLSLLIREKACLLHQKAAEKGLVRGRSISEVAVAALYLTLRENRIVRSLKEISEATGVKVKNLTRCYRLLLKELDRSSPPPSNSPVGYISKVSTKLQISGELQGDAIRLLQNIKGGCGGKDPKGLAAAALYIVCKDKHAEVTQKDLALTAGVTEVTVRNRYKWLEEMAKEAA